MKIAQVVPLEDGTPPAQHSGFTHRHIYDLTEALVEAGHDVTVFGTTAVESSAEVEAVCDKSLATYPGLIHVPQAILLERAFFSGVTFDVIHSHLDVLAFPCARRSASAVLTTIHRLVLDAHTGHVLRYYRDLPLIAVMGRQRKAMPSANWIGTIYPGLPAETGPFSADPGRYVLFMDRIAPDTDPLTALSVARRVGLPLVMIGTVDPAAQDYFDYCILPLIRERDVHYAESVHPLQRGELLANASALLGSTVTSSPGECLPIEALACGTPILLHAETPYAELVEEGITGFTYRTDDELETALKRIDELDRAHCRDAFEANFTVDRMVEDYLGAYERVIDKSWTFG